MAQPEELALEGADIQPLVPEVEPREVEVVHQRVGLPRVGDVCGGEVVRPVVHRPDRDAERRAERADVLHRVGRDARGGVGDVVAEPAREGKVGVVGDGLDREHRARGVGLLRRLAVHEDAPLAGRHRGEGPELAVRVHRGVEVGAGGNAVRRVPDVPEVVVRHRRAGGVRELRRREGRDVLVVRVVAVVHGRLGRAVAVREERRIVGVGRDAAEGAAVAIAALRHGQRPEREAARDGVVALAIADVRARDESALDAVAPVLVGVGFHGGRARPVD